MPSSCPSCTLTSSKGVYGGQGSSCMAHQERGKPSSLRLLLLSVGYTSSGTPIKWLTIYFMGYGGVLHGMYFMRYGGVLHGMYFMGYGGVLHGI